MIGQQSEDDLQVPGALIAGMAVMRQWAMTTFEVRRGQVIKHQRALFEVTRSQLPFDLVLTLDQPIQSRVQLIFTDRAQA